MSDTFPNPLPPPPGPVISDLFHYKGYSSKQLEQDIIYQIEHTIDENGNFLNYKLLKNNRSIAADVATTDDTTLIDHIPTHLQVSEDREILIIDSANSGLGRTKRHYFDAVMKPVLKDLGITKYKYFLTENKSSIETLTKNEINKKETTVILLSGDTSLFEMINTFLANKVKTAQFKINFMIIPLGTGNACAYSAGFTNELVAFARLFSDKISQFPIYKATFPEGSTFYNSQPVTELFFTVVFSWGIYSDLMIISDSEEMRPYGPLRFKIAFKSIMERPELNYVCELSSIGGKTIVPMGNNIFTDIISVPLAERNYMLSPSSNILTNQLHLLNFAGSDFPDRCEFAQLLFAAYQQGAHVHHPKVLYEELNGGVELKFGQEGEANVCLDGGIVTIKDVKNKIIKVEVLKDLENFKFGLIGV